MYRNPKFNALPRFYVAIACVMRDWLTNPLLPRAARLAQCRKVNGRSGAKVA